MAEPLLVTPLEALKLEAAMLEKAEREPLGTVGVLIVPVLSFSQLKLPAYPAD